MISPLTIAIAVAVVTTSALLVTLFQASVRRRSLLLELETNRQHANRELQLARNERDGLLDALSDAFLIIDDSHHINYANSAALRLFNAKELNNRHIRETCVDSRLNKAILDCLNSDTSHQVKITLPHTPSFNGQNDPGTSGHWVIESAPMTSLEGVSPATRILIRDVTQEHQTEQIRKDFVANASHELRTPMSIIHGYLENLLDDVTILEDRESVLRFLAVMIKHSERMSRIIEDMLVISRLESGEDDSTLNIEPFQLKECLQDILDRLEALIRNQQAKVTLELEEDSMSIRGDRFYWTQTLFNLVENALKQNPRPGLTIRIGCRTEGDRQLLWVADDGVGIPSADLPHIFRRFYRVDKNHTQSEVKGTGLGLSIVKRAVEAHQGTITASSTPGSETKFLISIPREGPTSSEVPVQASLTTPRIE